MMNTVKRIYLHYPFCVKLCHYCNFSAGVTPHKHFFQRYHEALLQEIQFYQDKFDLQSIAQDSFYLGGGTPSLMPIDFMEQVFRLIPLHPHSEITLEINPETVTLDKAKAWKELGINRVSLGWQSMDNHTLKLLGRSSTAEDNIQAFEILRNVGFDNISVDRILSVQGDQDQNFLDIVKQLQPEHISTYQLSIEAKTVLSLWAEQKKYQQVPDQEALKIEAQTELELSQLGYHRYEISNYAKVGKEAQHNTAYWNYEYWLGLGSGACGFLPEGEWGQHYQNHFNFNEYCSAQSKVAESEVLNYETALKEYLMLGIRKQKGISKDFLAKKFQKKWEELFPQGIDHNYFEEDIHFLKLKKEAIPLCNPATLSLWESLHI